MTQGLHYNGTNYDDFKAIFLEYFDADCLDEIWEFMEIEGDKFLDEDEIFKVEAEKIFKEEPKIDGDVLFGYLVNPSGLLGYQKQLGTTHYYVNIKKITLICLQIVIEMTIQAKIQKHALMEQSVPVLPTILQLKKCFGRLQEENGELCIAMEIERNKEGFIGWESFTDSRNECVNNYMTCSYNQGGYCRLNQDIFDQTLKALCEKNVIYKEESKYRISF